MVFHYRRSPRVSAICVFFTRILTGAEIGSKSHDTDQVVVFVKDIK